jgi:hypothetical protein
MKDVKNVLMNINGPGIPGITSEEFGSYVSKEEIVKQITLNCPIAVDYLKLTSGKHHTVLIIGFDGLGANMKVIFIEPMVGNVSPMPYLSYDDFMANSDHIISNSLIITKDHPIIVGPYDRVTIPSGPELFTDPADASSYTSAFINNTTPNGINSWLWTLRFFHADGEYIVSTSAITFIVMGTYFGLIFLFADGTTIPKYGHS